MKRKKKIEKERYHAPEDKSPNVENKVEYGSTLGLWEKRPDVEKKVEMLRIKTTWVR